MAANYLVWKIDNNHSDSNYKIIPKEKEYEIPHEVEVGIYLNHSILFGEIVGLKMEELLWVVDMLHRVGQDLEEDLGEQYNGVPIITEIAEKALKEIELVYNELHQAVDANARPLDTLNGHLLKKSPSIGVDEEGRLFFHSHHMYLFDLLEVQIRIMELIRYAFKENVLLRQF